jgi:hypothetical protein
VLAFFDQHNQVPKVDTNRLAAQIREWARLRRPFSYAVQRNWPAWLYNEQLRVKEVHGVADVGIPWCPVCHGRLTKVVYESEDYFLTAYDPEFQTSLVQRGFQKPAPNDDLRRSSPGSANYVVWVKGKWHYNLELYSYWERIREMLIQDRIFETLHFVDENFILSVHYHQLGHPHVHLTGSRPTWALPGWPLLNALEMTIGHLIYNVTLSQCQRHGPGHWVVPHIFDFPCPVDELFGAYDPTQKQLLACLIAISCLGKYVHVDVSKRGTMSESLYVVAVVMDALAKVTVKRVRMCNNMMIHDQVPLLDAIATVVLDGRIPVSLHLLELMSDLDYGPPANVIIVKF